MDKLKRSELSLALAMGLTMLISACGGGGDKGPTEGVNGTYLHISTPEFYFGNRDVGSRATQEIEIANHGADVYPIRAISLEGANADEFETDIYDSFELGPAEAVRVKVSFTPITDGKKLAQLAVDYDTIQMVDDAVNQHEQAYYQARSLERNGQYGAAKTTYRDYIEGDPVTSNKRRAAIKLPIIEEGAVNDASEDLRLYLAAVDARDQGYYDEAKRELDALRTLYPDSHLADDALYLNGYIALIDEENAGDALSLMQELKRAYPDSAYYDTALYSEALAQKDLGNTNIAREILLDLKYRHTGLEALGMSYPKDDLTSRLWFDRADKALEELG